MPGMRPDRSSSGTNVSRRDWFRVPGSGFLGRLVFCLWNTPTLSFGFLRPIEVGRNRLELALGESSLRQRQIIWV
jgi:hypothetical protein